MKIGFRIFVVRHTAMHKKYWAIVFLLFANIILLGHAVIPHYHNNCLPSLVASHGHDDEDCKRTKNDHQSDKHGHENHKDLQNCLLSQFFVNQSNPHRIEIKYLDYYNPLADLFSILPAPRFEAGFFSTVFLRFSAHLRKADYANFVNRCSGLRAPPQG